MVEHRPGVHRAEEDVEIADRLIPAPEAPARLRADHAGMRLDGLEDGRYQTTGGALQDPVADRLEELDPFQDLGLGLCAEARGLGDLARFGRPAKIRQALDLALDKDVLAHSVLKDRFFATNHIVPQGMPGYNPNLTGPDGATTHGNPAMAKQLLQQGMQEEGWSSISQIPTIKVTYPATSNDAKNYVAAMIQRWQTVLNLNVISNPEDFNKELDDINAATNNAKGIQMWRIAWIADYPDPQDWTTLQFDKGSPGNNMNYGQNQSTDAAEQQQVQQQLEQADVMQDPTARLKTYNDLEQKLVNDVAWLPLYQVNDLYLLKSYVQGYSENPEGLNPPDSWSQVYIASH